MSHLHHAPDEFDAFMESVVINFTHCRGCGMEFDPYINYDEVVDGLCVQQEENFSNPGCTALVIEWAQFHPIHGPAYEELRNNPAVPFWTTDYWSIIIDDWAANRSSIST